MDTNIHIRKKDKGYQYIVSYKVNGIWRQKSKQGFTKASEAKKEAQIVEHEIKERYSIATSEYSYSFEYVANMKMLEGNLSAGTIESQKYALKRYSAIAKKNMEDITYLDILEILKEAKEKYKYSTFYGMYAYGKSVFDYGIKKLKLPRYNPFEEYNIIPPKKSDAKAKQALTSSQLADLISKLYGEIRLITAIMGYTGLRLSEARALRRENIDLKNNELHVVVQKNASGKVTDSLKSQNSYRTVPIPSELKKIISESPLPFDFLFSKKIFSTDLIRRYRNAGYNISAHDLRHTYTTLLIEKGIDFKTIALLIGDSIQMVLKTYSHVNLDMYQKAKNRILENF